MKGKKMKIKKNENEEYNIYDTKSYLKNLKVIY